jgi:hypothetical protein
MLTAIGVPNSNGQLRWPLALRSMAETDYLREQLDALFFEAAEEALDGLVNQRLLHEIDRAVDKLRTLVKRDREERFRFSETAYEDAERFLDYLKDATRMLREGWGTEEGKASRR